MNLVQYSHSAYQFTYYYLYPLIYTLVSANMLDILSITMQQYIHCKQDSNN